MELNTCLTQRVAISCDDLPWLPSPEPGVERRLLERSGGEVARATSLVRYGAGAQFSAHEHAMGEEFLVLAGVFEDEHGVYPEGSYVRNPWGSRHSPRSPLGCTLFVKLRQMPSTDTQRAIVQAHASTLHALGPALARQHLHAHGGELVAIESWGAGFTSQPRYYPCGMELFVLAGEFGDELGRYPRHTWLRLPAASSHAPWTWSGCTVWIKTGHIGK